MYFLNKNKASISVIVPAYNAERHINKCLDSILNQSFKDFEIIAINDCSNDNTLRILNTYANNNPSINIINNSINLGAGASRNHAMRLAKGKYITFIDSDDWFSTNYLDCLHNKAEETHADIVFSNMNMVDNGLETEFQEFYSLFKKYQNSSSIEELPLDWRSTAPWMKLFRKNFIKKHDLVFMEGIRLGAEDIPFSWIAYFVAKKIAFCENAYYYYNLTDDSLDRSVNRTILEIFDALDFTKEKYKSFDPKCMRKSQLDLLFVSHISYQFSKIVTSINQQNKDLADTFWKKAHKKLIDITPANILVTSYSSRFFEFYIDMISHSVLDEAMKTKYFS
jgi:glycosyltransferase involved in cell wall biosynthesis